MEIFGKLMIWEMIWRMDSFREVQEGRKMTNPKQENGIADGDTILRDRAIASDTEFPLSTLCLNRVRLYTATIAE